jgi:tetratricopeptide (TPR) repeat protein
VTAGAQSGGSQHTDTGALLQLAMSRPNDAIAKAREILASRPEPGLACIAHQTAGIVLRDNGDVQAGVLELRAALRQARRSGSAEREADVLASLGVALVYANRTAHGLRAFDRAAELASGAVAGQVLHRRGGILCTLGRYAAALDDLQRAIGALQRAGDRVWTARALNSRGIVYLALGLPARADADFVAAGNLYAETNQELASASSVQNRGVAAFRSGDLPAALALLDEAGQRHRLLSVRRPSLNVDRCDILLAAGLVSEALTEVDEALQVFELTRVRSTERAALLLMAAECAVAASQPQAALERAQRASRLFRSQQSEWWQAHSGLLEVRARYAIGPVSARLLHAAERAAARLEDLRSAEALQAHVLAGRVALHLGRLQDARRHLSAAAVNRHRGVAMSRVAGWLSEALLADAEDEPRRVLAACRRGLDVLDQYRWTLGASELRAKVTAHGAELAALAQRHAARMRRPRTLLAWSERWRATALAVPAVRPPAGGGFDADLAALRQITGQVEEARRQGQPTTTLDREQLRLEKAVRATSLRTRGTQTSAGSAFNISDLLDALGHTRLIEITDIDGALHVLLCGAGRVRQFTAGRTQDAVRATDFARFALRRLARGRPRDDPGSALAILESAGPALQDAVLGEVARQLPDGPVVVVPPGKLHAIPWALLPRLQDRVFSVAPSASAWLRAHAARPPERRHATLVAGPDLVTGGAEVPAVAGFYDDVAVLTGAQATADRVLGALDGAWLAHIAAHGTFRADSPMFSSLRMHDGPLTVYDFEKLERAPHRLVLSSCESGLLAPAGADELLGLVSSLLPLGTAGIAAGVVPLNDLAVVPLMIDLHRSLSAGRSLAEALHSMRSKVSGDPAQRGAALSLVALGAG